LKEVKKLSNNLQLVKSDKFGNVQCDFYSDGTDYLMTREQIGTALEYANPQKAIDNLHAKHQARMDKDSVTLKVRATDGKFYDTTVYSRKGIMEICRWSQQPKADAFMDFVWNIMDALMRGTYTVQQPNSNLAIAEQLLLAAKNQEQRIQTLEDKQAQLENTVKQLPAVNKVDWLTDAKSRVEAITGRPFKNSGFLLSNVYKDIEKSENVLLNSRLARYQKKMLAHGSTMKEIKDISKFYVISLNDELRAAFDRALDNHAKKTCKKSA
jgi:hypothetical protein